MGARIGFVEDGRELKHSKGKEPIFLNPSHDSVENKLVKTVGVPLSEEKEEVGNGDEAVVVFFKGHAKRGGQGENEPNDVGRLDLGVGELDPLGAVRNGLGSRQDGTPCQQRLLDMSTYTAQKRR